jgi:hypothetical protein
MAATPAIVAAFVAAAPPTSFARLHVSSFSRHASFVPYTKSRMTMSCSSRKTAPPARAAWK